MCFPLFEPPFRPGIQPRPTLGFAADAAAPRFWGQPGAEAILSLAKFPVKRVSAQRFEYAIGHIRIRFHQSLRGQQTQAGPSPVNPPAPFSVVAGPGLNCCHRHTLLVHRWREVWFAKKPFEESGRLRFGQINVHKHHAGSVEHPAAVGITRDHGGGFTRTILDFLQYLFAEWTIRVVTAGFGRKIPGPKTVRQLLGGLVGERLGIGKALRRPAPAKEISTTTPGPELREVHAKESGKVAPRWQDYFDQCSLGDINGRMRVVPKFLKAAAGEMVHIAFVHALPKVWGDSSVWSASGTS